MQIVILSGPGWHADELSRALAERGHAGRVLPYEGLVARLGRLRATGASAFAEAPADRRSLGGGWSASQDRHRRLSCEQTSVLDADAVLARFIPSGSLEQIIYRVDALHWIEEHGVPVVNSPRAGVCGYTG